MSERVGGESTGEKTRQRARDELLCFCEDVAHDAFRDVVWADAEMSFEKACAITGVGSKCTSCLLNAETLYVHAVETRPKAVRQPVWRRRTGPIFDKRTLYRLVDRTMPQVARTTNGIIPVVAGPDVRTVLSIANSVASTIGPRSSAFRIEMTFRGPDGAVLMRRRARLAPGERLDLDIAEGLDGDGGLTAGGAWLRWRAETPGFFGTIRPHYKVITPVSVTAVHSQGRGIGQAYFQSIAVNRQEEQYLSVVNCEERPSLVRMQVVQGAATLAAVEAAVPAFGSRLVPVPVATLADSARGRPFGLVCRSETETRWHLVVCAGTPPRISLDHA